MTKEWPPADVARLCELWNQGARTPEIARIMRRSKNAVCNKAHRLNLVSRPSPIIHGHPPRIRPWRPKPLPPSPMLPIPPARTCQWPIGTPGAPGFGFCDVPDVVPGTSYCRACCALAFVKRTAA